MKMRYQFVAVMALALLPLISQAGSFGLDSIRDHDGISGTDFPGIKDHDNNGGTSHHGIGSDPTDRNKGGNRHSPHGDHDRNPDGGIWHDDHGRDGINPVPESAPTAMLLGGSFIALLALAKRQQQSLRFGN
jgi:hypothetical protein